MLPPVENSSAQKQDGRPLIHLHIAVYGNVDQNNRFFPAAVDKEVAADGHIAQRGFPFSDVLPDLQVPGTSKFKSLTPGDAMGRVCLRDLLSEP